MLVQALVAQATVKALDEAVLLRLARRDLMPLDPGVLAPGEDGVTGQFGAIVADHRARQLDSIVDQFTLAISDPSIRKCS